MFHLILLSPRHLSTPKDTQIGWIFKPTRVTVAAIEVLGERRPLLVVSELTLGASTFSAIIAGTGAPRDRIAARLKSLVDAGIVDRVAYPATPQRFEYRLTKWGEELAPLLRGS
jgi:DNA-binding HxlR family transcriptional regulator